MHQIQSLKRFTEAKEVKVTVAKTWRNGFAREIGYDGVGTSPSLQFVFVTDCYNPPLLHRKAICFRKIRIATQYIGIDHNPIGFIGTCQAKRIYENKSDEQTTSVQHIVPIW
jgi:hypothetical protein